MQQFLKPPARTAWTYVVAPKFLDQFFFAVNDAMAALDVGLGRITLSTLTHRLKSQRPPGNPPVCAWDTSSHIYILPIRIYHNGSLKVNGLQVRRRQYEL